MPEAFERSPGNSESMEDFGGSKMNGEWR